ncbi:plasmid recombination protein [Hydrogenophaga sp.]|uniref:plasmid recombination protein n=1 Tax=Hydrogenophaga sp. TaxID=1904254 RepID=UPI0035AF9846
MAESTPYFRTKTISRSTYGGRKPQTLMDAARHNLREIQAERGADGYIDASRIAENVLLAGPGTADGVQALAGEWLAGAGVDASALRRDHCQAIEAVFSLHEQSGIEPVRYFRRCLEWVTAELRLPVLSAIIHLDEAAPHCHVLILPVQGSMHVGSKPIAKGPLKLLTESFFNKVAGPAGLKRHEAKMTGAVKRMAVAAVLRACEARGMSEKVGVLWPILCAAIERDPTKAVHALNLSDDEIRGEKTDAFKPIGFAETPTESHANHIGFQVEPRKMQNLSCVGFASPTTSSAPAEWAVRSAEASGSGVRKVSCKRIETLGDLWAVIGCRSVWRTTRHAPTPAALSPSQRLAVARAAQRDAIARQTREPARKAIDPAIRVGDDGTTRLRDEYAHDIGHWGD